MLADSFCQASCVKSRNNEKTDSVMGDYEIKRITYLSISSDPKTVVLTFVKQENGQFLLIRKFAVGLDRKEQTDSGVKV